MDDPVSRATDEGRAREWLHRAGVSETAPAYLRLSDSLAALLTLVRLTERAATVALLMGHVEEKLAAFEETIAATSHNVRASARGSRDALVWMRTRLVEIDRGEHTRKT